MFRGLEIIKDKKNLIKKPSASYLTEGFKSGGGGGIRTLDTL